MKKIILLTSILTSLLLSREDINDTSSIDFTLDTGVGFYNLDIQGSNYVRAVAYDIAELTLGFSENINSWQYGASYRGLIREISTNAHIPRTGGQDTADINRYELLLYTNYVLNLEKIINALFEDTKYAKDVGRERLSLNMIYYNSSLDIKNRFDLGSTFQNNYQYDTQGAKISLHYNLRPDNDPWKLWLVGGLVYTKAKLNFKEYKDTDLQPYYVNSNVTALGTNLGAGTSYDINYRTKVKFIIDWYKVDFGEINIMSRTQGFLGNAHFQENTTSVRMGISYKL